MNFLNRELEQLPEGLRVLILAQMEKAIRETVYTSEQDCMFLCARLRALLELAAAYKPTE